MRSTADGEFLHRMKQFTAYPHRFESVNLGKSEDNAVSRSRARGRLMAGSIKITGLILVTRCAEIVSRFRL